MEQKNIKKDLCSLFWQRKMRTFFTRTTNKIVTITVKRRAFNKI